MAEGARRQCRHALTRKNDELQLALFSSNQWSEESRQVTGAHVRLPFFSRDLLEHVDLEIPIGHHLLQPTVLLLELA